MDSILILSYFLGTAASGKDVTKAASALVRQQVLAAGGGQGRGRGYVPLKASLWGVIEEHSGAVKQQAPSVARDLSFTSSEAVPTFSRTTHLSIKKMTMTNCYVISPIPANRRRGNGLGCLGCSSTNPPLRSIQTLDTDFKYGAQ